MKIEIFNVEHGACALLTDDGGQRIMVDCGHNVSTGWKPGTYLRSIGVTYLERLWITNYDEDHVSGLNDLLANVRVGTLARNTDVTPALITHLKRNNTPGAGIARLIHEATHNFGPPGIAAPGNPFPQFSGINEHAFWNTYPQFDDENNLSAVIRFECAGVTIMFTGDMEKQGWTALLRRPDFQQALLNVDIFVASHHGREDGYYEPMFQHLRPRFVVVSDKSIVHETQKTGPMYAQKASGGIFNGEQNRKFVTTRSDGSLLVLPDAVNRSYIFTKLI